ncbi:hypothetical protein N7U49_26515 [Streptomyces sp. AD2-2]|nr:hypothetical protein N7U49_26515 [Streptomyces sp. AD2-2]
MRRPPGRGRLLRLLDGLRGLLHRLLGLLRLVGRRGRPFRVHGRRGVLLLGVRLRLVALGVSYSPLRRKLSVMEQSLARDHERYLSAR